MKEICIINYVSTAAQYGIGTFIKEYIKCLKEIGCKITLVELGTDEDNKEFRIKKKGSVREIHIPYIIDKGLAKYNKNVSRLLFLYLTDSPNLIFNYHYIQSNTLHTELIRYFPCAKNIFTIHYLAWSHLFNGDSMEYIRIVNTKKTIEKENAILKNYRGEKKFMSAMDAIVCLSEDTLALVNTLYNIPKKKLFLIKNGSSLSISLLSENEKKKQKKKLYIDENEKIIVFVGRINKIKGIEPLLKSFEKVLAEYPQCRLIMIGDSVAGLNIKNYKKICTKITLTGKLSKEDLYMWYQIADIGVFPSFYEECSYVGIEMLVHGLPIVASDGYSVKNMFNDSNAIIANIGNYKNLEKFVQNLTESILGLLKADNKTIVLKRQAAIQSFENKFSQKNMQEVYFNFINRL